MSFPTHRHLPTGDIVFPPKGAPRKDYELLPDDYWPARCAEEQMAADIRMIKEEAARRILEIAPFYVQLNDAFNQDDPDVMARRAAIDAIRADSNAQEAALMAGREDPQT